MAVPINDIDQLRNGCIHVNGTSLTTAPAGLVFCSITAVGTGDATFTSLTGAINGAGMVLPKNVTIYGLFPSFQLTSGAVFANYARIAT